MTKEIMIKEITKAILALAIVGGAVYAALTGNLEGLKGLEFVAGIVVGSYFGQSALSALGNAFKKNVPPPPPPPNE